MKRMLMNLKPTRLEDLIAATSLFAAPALQIKLTLLLKTRIILKR